MSYELEFYYASNGSAPVEDWLDRLSPAKQAAAQRSLTKILAVDGIDVLGTEWGKPLDDGLYEFRIKHDADAILAQRDPELAAKLGPQPSQPMLLRIFFAFDGQKIILLVGGYDKGQSPSKKRQQKEIKIARKRLAEHKRREGAGSDSRRSFRRWWIGQVR